MVELSSETSHSALTNITDGRAMLYRSEIDSVLLRYHLCAISVLVAACTAAVPVPMFLGEIGAVRRDCCQSERSKARWEAIGM